MTALYPVLPSVTQFYSVIPSSAFLGNSGYFGVILCIIVMTELYPVLPSVTLFYPELLSHTQFYPDDCDAQEKNDKQFVLSNNFIYICIKQIAMMQKGKIVDNGHWDYERLLCYKKAKIIYDLTFHFCSRFIDKRDRTHDQMIQAARSGKQNIVEGYVDSATSYEVALKLDGGDGGAGYFWVFWGISGYYCDDCALPSSTQSYPVLPSSTQ